MLHVYDLQRLLLTFMQQNQTQIEIENEKIQTTSNQVKLVWKVFQPK